MIELYSDLSVLSHIASLVLIIVPYIYCGYNYFAFFADQAYRDYFAKIISANTFRRSKLRLILVCTAIDTIERARHLGGSSTSYNKWARDYEADILDSLQYKGSHQYGYQCGYKSDYYDSK